MSKEIELKILSEHFENVKKGIKKAELRYNDRNFAVGDFLLLREWTGSEYTGRFLKVIITHILQNCGFGLADGYAILSIELCTSVKVFYI